MFLVIWTALAIYYLCLADMDALLLWIILPIPFGAMLLVALRARHVVLTFFMGAIFLSHAVMPPVFFTERDKATYSGWTAVKNFRFEVFDFLRIYAPVLLYVFTVLVITLVLREVVSRRKSAAARAAQNRTYDRHMPDDLVGERTYAGGPDVRYPCRRQTHERVHTVLLITAVFAACAVHTWMYRHGIAMTGVAARVSLPFRLAGGWYYSSRFLLPILLFWVYMRTSRSWVLAILLSAYGLWAGISQLSRFALALPFCIVLFFSYLDKQRLRFAIVLVTLALAFECVSKARYAVCMASDGVVRADTSRPLGRLAWQMVLKHGIGSPIAPLFSAIDRLQGTQDVVLTSQYDTGAMGGSLREFQRLFLFGSHVSGREVGYALYGFFPHRGYSVGSGGLSARVLQIAGSNWFVLIAVSAWISLLLSVGEGLVQCYAGLFRSKPIGYAIGGLYIVLLYTSGIVSRLYGFILLASLVVFLHNLMRTTKAAWRFGYPMRSDGGQCTWNSACEGCAQLHPLRSGCCP